MSVGNFHSSGLKNSKFSDMDIATPRNVQLSGFFRRSTAVVNAKEKIPNCLMAIANELTSRLSDIRQQYGEESAEELSTVITKIQTLRAEVLQDIPFRKLMSSGPDVKFYNDYLEKMTSLDCRPTMLQAIGVYAECYVYRRVWECFELTNRLKQFDPYEQLKSENLKDCSVLLKKMAKFFAYMQENPSEEKYMDFEKLVKLNLWSNKRDRPLKDYLRGQLKNIKDIDAADVNILCNDCRQVWNLFQSDIEVIDSDLIVDFILDRCGYELFQDFCLADFLTLYTPVAKIRFHPKSLPWFIWSATEKDIDNLFNRMKEMPKTYVQNLVSRWINYIQNEKWQIIVRKFWCLPNNFNELKSIDPWLYRTLSESKLIILKGDINYQKALGDYNRNPEIPLSIALDSFHLTNTVFIRILKSDLICGLDKTTAKKLDTFIRNISKGYLGIIQFTEKPLQLQCLLEKTLTKFDPYESLKQTLFWAALPIMNKTAQYLRNIYKCPSEEELHDFEKLIKLNLWAHQDDIAFYRDKERSTKCFSQMLNVKRKDSLIICNQVQQAWEVISDKSHPSNVIAFICDNVGFEFFLELCLADYLYTNYYATSIHFHVKHIPWFILDVTEVDIHWILLHLGKNGDKYLQKMSTVWKEHFKTGRWKIVVRKYWTLPIGFTRMKEIDPLLFKMLEESKVVIIKGDMNYRKLFEDKNLEPSTPISDALAEFHPSNVLLVRIMKSEVCCNIKPSLIEILESLNKNWMDSGIHGFIQFAPKPKVTCDCQGL